MHKGTRRTLVLAASVTVALLAVFSAIGFSLYYRPPAASDQVSRVYQLEFTQESNCPGGVWFDPWGVVVNGQIKSQPPNANLLSLGTVEQSYVTNDSYGVITFFLANGTYGYRVLPTGSELQSEQSGIVTINGSNTVVQMYAFIQAEGCATTSG